MFLILAPFAYSATSQEAQEPENVKVVRQYLEAWNSGKTNDMKKVLDSNVVYFNTSPGGHPNSPTYGHLKLPHLS